MDHYDEEILRLNKKIRQLIWQNEQNMSRSNVLEAENKRLSLKVEEMKEICSLTSTLNVKYKTQLDREAGDKAELIEANHKLKLKLNELTTRCHQLGQKVKLLEANLGRQPASRLSQPPPVRVISSISEVIVSKPSASNKALVDLQKRFDELEVEHKGALNVIDELEFELGDIDYLEMETQRLQQENTMLRDTIQRAGISTSTSLSPTVQDVNSEAGHNLSNSMPKASDDETGEEEQEDRAESAFTAELKEIHMRKMIAQQRLEQFHHRHDAVSQD